MAVATTLVSVYRWLDYSSAAADSESVSKIGPNTSPIKSWLLEDGAVLFAVCADMKSYYD